MAANAWWRRIVRTATAVVTALVGSTLVPIPAGAMYDSIVLEDYVIPTITIGGPNGEQNDFMTPGGVVIGSTTIEPRHAPSGCVVLGEQQQHCVGSSHSRQEPSLDVSSDDPADKPPVSGVPSTVPAGMPGATSRSLSRSYRATGSPSPSTTLVSPRATS